MAAGPYRTRTDQEHVARPRVSDNPAHEPHMIIPVLLIEEEEAQSLHDDPVQQNTIFSSYAGQRPNHYCSVVSSFNQCLDYLGRESWHTQFMLKSQARRGD